MSLIRENRFLATSLVLCSCFTAAAAESRRLTDDQVKELMEEVEKDVDRFAKAVDSNFRTATIRRADAEISIDGFLSDLKKNCRNMKERFEDEYAASAEVLSCLRQASAIERRASSASGLFGAEKEWPRLRGSLGRLSAAYGVDWSSSPETWSSRRANDRELVKRIEGVSSHADSFEKSLEAALKYVDGVAKEERKRAFDALDRVTGSADDLKDAVEDGKDAAKALALMSSSSDVIGSFLAKYRLENAVGSTWNPLQAELAEITAAFPRS